MKLYEKSFYFIIYLWFDFGRAYLKTSWLTLEEILVQLSLLVAYKEAAYYHHFTTEVSTLAKCILKFVNKALRSTGVQQFFSRLRMEAQSKQVWSLGLNIVRLRQLKIMVCIFQLQAITRPQLTLGELSTLWNNLPNSLPNVHESGGHSWHSSAEGKLLLKLRKHRIRGTEPSCKHGKH